MGLNSKWEEAQRISKKWYFIKKNYTTDKGRITSYFVYRVLRPLFKGYFRLYRFLNAPTPWIAPAATVILKRTLTKDNIGIEYGSGLSSVFISKYIGQLISIEHYHPWYDKVNKLLLKNGITNVDLRLVLPKKLKELPENPSKLEQQEIKYGNSYFDYYEYSNAVNEFPDEYFDFALIDGRSRVACMRNTIAKVKEGGMIVLDNSDRKRYQEAFKLLEQYPKVFTSNGLTDTTIWFKISL